MDEQDAAAAGSSTPNAPTGPYELRITDHGKIHYFVSFALKFLQENPERPLVFHTFPSTKPKPAPKPPANGQSPKEPLPDLNNEAQTSPADEPPKKKRKLAKPTATIPRLVSVVEIVKREYGKWAAIRKTPDGGSVKDALRTGVHQYNELACLEDLGIIDSQEREPDEAEQLRLALEGKNFLKQEFTPHLKVTLSVHALPDLEGKGATHQPPPPPPVIKSKSAKARERRRIKKKEMEAEMAAD